LPSFDRLPILDNWLSAHKNMKTPTSTKNTSLLLFFFMRLRFKVRAETHARPDHAGYSECR
jgi:hypothetical protein